MLFSFNGVSLSFGAEQILEQVNLTCEPRDRIALIGQNGAGKSTLLNLVAGELVPDEGEIYRQADIRIGYLRQNSGLALEGTIAGEMKRALGEIYRLEARLLEVSHQMAEAKGENYQKLEGEYHRLSLEFEAREGYQADVRINTVLTGMGFGGFDRETPISTLSGGERTRLALCKLLLEEPQLLILDEATNHLDFKMLMWLEEYLSTYRGAIVTVSHDRYFLDKVTSITWEIEGLSVIAYPAPYSGYLTLREERITRMQKEYERKIEEIARLQEYHDRNIVRATTSSSAKSRLRMIEHLGDPEKPIGVPKPPVIRFTSKIRPVKDVLTVSNLTLAVGEGESRKTLFQNFDFEIKRGERVAIIGENGVGKSTLLKAIGERIPVLKGEIEWGRNVKPLFYDQDDGALHLQKTALDELWDRFPGRFEQEIRNVLGGLRLSGDEVYKRVEVLSGGERARLKLAILMLETQNMLIMDEPTNHLDIDAKEALEKALREFDGTVLVVSHDRYLLNHLPTRMVFLGRDHVESFEGGFDDYIARAQAQEAPRAKEKKPESTSQGDYHRSKKQRSEEAALKRRTAAVEAEIAELEELCRTLEARMADPQTASDYQKLDQTASLLEENRNRLEELYSEWEELLSRAE